MQQKQRPTTHLTKPEATYIAHGELEHLFAKKKRNRAPLFFLLPKNASIPIS